MTDHDSRINRRKFVQSTTAGLGAVGLAGCLGGGGDGGGDEISGTITIGLLAPQPGSYPGGTAMANAGEMAGEEINADGGVAGEDVEVIVKDTELTPSVARTAYQELILEEQVDMTTGVYSSESFLNIMDVVADNETIHMSSAAITPEMNTRIENDYETYKYLIRVGPPNGINLGRNMVNFAEDMFSEIGWDRVGLVVEDIEGFVDQVETVRNGLSDMDVTIAEDISYASDTEDFTTIFDQLESANVDGAFVFMATGGTPAIVQWQTQERPFGMGGLHAPSTAPGYYDSVDGACEGLWTYASASATSEITDKTLPFVERYNEEYGANPGYLGYTTYDAVHMWAEAVDSLGSLNQNDLISEVKDMEYTGVTGVIDIMGQDSEFPHDPRFGEGWVRPIKFQWQEEDGEGVQETIWPSEIATAEFQDPPWA